MFSRSLVFRSAAFLLSGLMLFTISAAVLNTLIPLWIGSTLTAGLVGSCYFMGNLIGALVSGKMLKLWGFHKSYCFACLFFALSTIVLLLSLNPFWWGFSRLLAGIACAMIWVIVESALLKMGTLSNRGMFLAAYMVVYYLGTVTGQLLLNIVPTTSESVLPWSSLLFVCAMIPISMVRVVESEQGNINTTKRARLSTLLARHDLYLSIVGCIISGIIIGSLYNLLPLYLSYFGYSKSQVATWIAWLVSAGILGQFPIGRLADHYGRCFVLKLLAGLIITASIIMLVDSSFLGLSLFLLGCASFTLYPVTMAWGCEKVKHDELVTMNQLLLISYTVGSLLGSACIAAFMKYYTNDSLFMSIMLFDVIYFVLLLLNKNND